LGILICLVVLSTSCSPGRGPREQATIKFELPLDKFDVPREFSSPAALDRWVDGLRTRFHYGSTDLQAAEFVRIGQKYHLIAAMGFSGRRAVGLICFREAAGTCVLDGMDTWGVDLSMMMDERLSVTSKPDRLVLLSGKHVLAEVRWPLPSVSG
jgi:hypothetical protein